MNGLDRQSFPASSSSEMPILKDEPWIDESLQAAALQQITQLMERLVKIRPLTAESRFIDLTSDIRKAFIFIREFQRRFDFDLPFSAFFDTPTIRDLARVAVTKRMPPLSRLVLLRTGDPDIPPLFLVPGLGGVVFELLELFKQVDYAGSIYAFTVPGIDGVDPPCTSTVQMGQENFALAHELYPSGPYRFLGHSSGGVSTFEMTRSAGKSGAEVDFFGVLDTNFAQRAWPLDIWLRHMVQQITKPVQPKPARKPEIAEVNLGKSEDVKHLDRLKLKISALIDLAAKVGSGFDRVRRKIDQRFFKDPTSAAFVKADPYYIPDLPPKFQRVRDAAISMAVCYKPTYWDCELFLFQAEFGDALACDPVLTWSRFVKKIILRPTPGDHMTMLVQPHVATVAREVSLSLAEVEKSRDHTKQRKVVSAEL